MLVLTRKIGEGIIIGDDITVKVIEVKGGSIRLGIDAPREKKIHRQEVYERIIEENRNAANWEITDLDSLDINLSKEKKE
jgi:carbon storage regulator